MRRSILFATGAAAAVLIFACVGSEDATTGTSTTDAATGDGTAGDSGGGGDSASDGNTCTDLTSDPKNCGACGHVCATGFGCSASICDEVPIDVAAGVDFACAALHGGAVSCWGLNSVGQTGVLPTNTDSTCGVDKCRKPSLIPGLTDVVSISAGGQFACAVKVDGSVVCWGSNSEGALAQANTVVTSTPVGVVFPASVKISQVSCGQDTACARTFAGMVYCWGNNDVAQTGQAFGGSFATPQLVGVFNNDVIDVHVSLADHEHACAIRSDHTLWCWGSNDFNELGHSGGSSGDQSGGSCGECNMNPVESDQTHGSGPIQAVAVGHGSTCIIQDSIAWCDADNGFDQTGTSSGGGNVPTFVNVGGAIPLADAGPGAVVTAVEGYNQIFALDSVGGAYGWGADTFGFLGVGALDGGVTCENGSLPCFPATALPAVTSGWAKISAGMYVTAGLTKDGRVLAWGINDDAQLGHLPDPGGVDHDCVGDACQATPAQVTLF